MCALKPHHAGIDMMDRVDMGLADAARQA